MRIDNPEIRGFLGQIIQVSLSASGAWSKSEWAEKGWAVCDGTSPSDQGISDAVITSTDDLRDRFLKCSNDESSGTTGGKKYARWARGGNDTDDNYNSIGATATNEDERWVLHKTWNSSGNEIKMYAASNTADSSIRPGGPDPSDYVDPYTETNEPQYYEIVYLIKVK